MGPSHEREREQDVQQQRVASDILKLIHDDVVIPAQPRNPSDGEAGRRRILCVRLGHQLLQGEARQLVLIPDVADARGMFLQARDAQRARCDYWGRGAL